MSLTPNSPNPTQLTLPQALQLAQTHWDAGHAQQAEQLCQRILGAWPYQSDALHLLGLIAHAHGRPDLAVAHVRQACMAPQAPALYFSNLAEMCRQQGLLTEAEQAGRQAIGRDPALVDGWSNLGIILQECGKLEASLECLQHVITLHPESPTAHNNLANTCRRLNQVDRAEQHYRKALSLNPAYAQAHSNLAYLLCSQGHFDAAVKSARQAIELNPRLTDAYLNIADIELQRLNHAQAEHWLNELHAFAPQLIAGLTARAQLLTKTERNDQALSWAQQALALAPSNASAHSTLGKALQALDRHQEALAHFEQAIALPDAKVEETMILRATLLQESGRKADASAAFDEILLKFPGSIGARVGRSDSQTYTAGDPDIAWMEAALIRPEGLLSADRMALHFALGKAYLDSRDSPRAFQHLNAANRLKRATFTYDANATHQWLQRITAAFPSPLPAYRERAHDASALPVFVLGMPRSGTTLVEQILASHPQVYGAGELSALKHAINSMGAFPDSLNRRSPAELEQVGRRYLEQIEPLAQGHARLVDKMPANFLYAALIPLILPGARIIHCRRDPVDTCLSCYSKQFGGEQLFAYDQTELGRFHRGYQAMMEHWRKILPADRFIEVDYESVVDDLEGQSKRLIEFIGLPWDNACLDFHTTQRVVRTASVNQVRQPIYATSKGRWRAHAAQLGPLLAALEIAVE